MATHKNDDFPRFSKSCKQFHKKNAIAFYILILDPDSKDLKHREMLRIVNQQNGEYYIIPRPLDKNDFHISYHKSGQFHWFLDQKYHFPLQQEHDFRIAFRDYLRIQAKFGWIIGYCVACGPKVEKDSLRKMLDLLSRYITVDFRSDGALNDVFEGKHVTQWNYVADHPEHIRKSPLGTGIMLAELKQSSGTLHTLNCTLTLEETLLLHRTETRRLLGFLPFKKKRIVYLSWEDIETTHVVLM